MGLAIFAAVAGILLRRRYTPALLIILFPLFVLFKGTIVSHDSGHVLISFPPMVGLAAFLLPVSLSRWESWRTQAVVAMACLGAGSGLLPLTSRTCLTKGADSWVSLCKLQGVPGDDPGGDSKVKDQLKLPSPDTLPDRFRDRGRLSLDICYVTANGLNWKPRFVFQSYVSLHSGSGP